MAPGDAASAVAAMRTLGIRGLSVTMPHKEAVLDELDELTPTALRLGAVNCITNTDGHLVGDNTDGEGFLLGYRHDSGRDVSGRSVVVLGAGGAARAIVLACADAGASVVTVINRTHDRAVAAAALAGRIGASNDAAALATADVVVNATPCGMAGTPQSADVPFEIEDAASHVDVIDIVYNPRITPLIAATRQADRTAFGGLSMLAGQAAAQFHAWTGLQPSLDVLVAAATGE